MTPMFPAAPLTLGRGVTCSLVAGRLRCVGAWPLDVSGVAIPSEARLQESQATLGDKIKGSAKKTLARSLQSSIGRSIRGIFGSGAVGRIAGDAAKLTTKDALDRNMPSEAAKNRALLEAFERVAERFRWEDSEERWVAA